ncbi:MAG: hypothetical protein JJU44_10500 [Planctomycetes bacterium]|nr:hypothetical protein [Planctomycetota bacterium]
MTTTPPPAAHAPRRAAAAPGPKRPASTPVNANTPHAANSVIPAASRCDDSNAPPCPASSPLSPSGVRAVAPIINATCTTPAS